MAQVLVLDQCSALSMYLAKTTFGGRAELLVATPPRQIISDWPKSIHGLELPVWYCPLCTSRSPLLAKRDIIPYVQDTRLRWVH